MTKKAIKYIVIVAALGILASAGISTCTRKVELKEAGNEAVLKSEINRNKAELVVLQNREQTLKERVKQDSVKAIASQNAFKREISKLKIKLAQARQPVQVLIDSVPALDLFVDLQDSTIKLQGDRIDTLELQKLKLFKAFNNLILLSDEKYKIQLDLNKHHQNYVAQLKKQVKRERNKKTFWKITAMVLTGGVVYVSVKD